MRDRLRQRAIVSLLRTHDGPPIILATQIFFLFDEKPFLSAITVNMTSEMVVLEVGKILCVFRSKATTDFGGRRPPISVHSDHSFRLIAATDSGEGGRA